MVSPQSTISREVLSDFFRQGIRVPCAVVGWRLCTQVGEHQTLSNRFGKRGKVVLQELEAQHMLDQKISVARRQEIRNGPSISRNPVRADNSSDEFVEPFACVTQLQQVPSFCLRVAIHGHHAAPRVARHREGFRLVPEVVTDKRLGSRSIKVSDTSRAVLVGAAESSAYRGAACLGDMDKNYCVFIDIAYQHEYVL